MPTGTTVMVGADGKKWNIPADQVQAATAKGLKPVEAAPAAPPATKPGGGGFSLMGPDGRLGEAASGIVRPIWEGTTGILTQPADWLTDIANLLPDKIGGVDMNRSLIPGLRGKLQAETGPDGKLVKPSDIVQRGIDEVTTPSSSRSGRIAEVLDSMLIGGIGGPKAPRVSSAPSSVRRLANEGVVMTPGQRAAAKGGAVGKSLGALEEKAGAIFPPIKSARAKTTEQWNTARVNEALEAAGEKPVPKGMTGRDALRDAYQKLRAAYSKALSNAKVNWNKDEKWQKATTDARARYSNLQKPEDSATNVLGPKQSAVLKDILDRRIVGASSRSGEVSGQKLKEIEETLRVEAEKHKRGDYQDRALAEILTNLRNEFKAMVTRQNPEAGKKLEQIDRGYANYKTSARAANYNVKVSSEGEKVSSGGYTPGQRLQSIRARDKSKDKNLFSNREAPGQKEAEQAQSVIGNTQPDSGTPFGNILSGLVLGVGGHAAFPGYGALLAGAVPAYSQPALRWLQRRALSDDPEILSTFGTVAGANQAGNPFKPDSTGIAR